MARRPRLTEESDRREATRLGPTDVQRHKLWVIGQMASSVAHELSNPLAAIQASVQTILAFKPKNGLSASFEQTIGAQAWDDLELILSEARRAGAILDGLLRFARHEKPDRRPTAVMEILERTEALSRNHLQTCNVTLQLNDTDQDIRDRCWGWVVVDSNQLQQVLLNLIINACQAIGTARSSGTISISARREGDHVLAITVEDDGPGVPPELRQAIFQPFYTTKPAGQGTGLGLSISVDIVRAHGGDIWVEDREHGGARFVIKLPATENTDPLETADAPTPIKRSRRRTSSERHNRWVLLIDDDFAVRRSVGRFLGYAGYHVEATSTGEAAIAMLRSHRFDAIISDLRMPGLSGEQFFHLVKCEFPNMASRIVFTSGDMMRQETRDFVQLSGCPSLHKPYELAELTQLLDDVCADSHGSSRPSSIAGRSRQGRTA